MNFVTWSFPTTIVFGKGSLSTLADHVKRNGGTRALVVGDPGVAKAGILAQVVKTLAEGGVVSHPFDEVDPNPVEGNIERGVGAYRDFRANVVVAVGGGSPLDAGKLIALKTTHDRPLADYDDAAGGDRFITSSVPPIVTIPTTAGTGSEVGRSGVVTLAATGRKTVIFSPNLLAKVAILDPMLTRSLPPRVTASTGFDALTHCLEAYVSTGDHPMADAIAIGGLELCAQHLERAVKHGDDLEARGGMMKAAMMGAVAFQKGLGACHSLAHPLSSVKGIHHGLANALCLPQVVEFNAAVVSAKLERLRTLLDPGAASLAGALRELRARVGLPAGLAAEGVTQADLDGLADKAFEDACHRSNPRLVTRDDLRALYAASL
jgi:4-hydroxybutyrate dehydrogenase